MTREGTAGEGTAGERSAGDGQPAAAAPAAPPAAPVARAAGTLPPGARAAGLWCLWALVVGLVVWFALQLAVLLGSVLLTFAAGLLLTALLRPVVTRLDRAGVNRLAATWLVVVGFVLLLGGAGWFLEQRIRGQLASLLPTLAEGLNEIRRWLTGTVGLSEEQVDSVVDGLLRQLTPGGDAGPAGQGGALGGGTLVTGVTTVVSLLAAVVLALFTAFWLVYDGERVWRHSLRAVPAAQREGVDAAGQQAWATLGGYLRGITLVALMDAVGIGIALVLIGVPLPFALALLTFLGAYVPIVGAFVAGIAAVVVAFAAGGITDALLTLGAVVLVQQVEGNLLQPVIMRRAVYLHPLATVYALTVGGLLYGLAGAVVAVPLTAVLYAVGTAVAARHAPAEEPPRRRRPPWRGRPPVGATRAGGAGPGG
ncbi:AI-2E family transporter [Geodermatophilus marinus]|uniref:AI-2E family transporter n=1 Tax=Geodermatophilus sp. LHW52908 TaxID=2303986 RepID=UPI000E3BE6F7|nr:AI-2E family transporter [Geodermatophilus sp. LHW52908]RFU19540.1 AI-2E family transporter [Geodermatophilus sp. LHW52908]